MAKSSSMAWILAAIYYACLVHAQRALYSNSFETCVDDSQLTATHFNVSITPDNNTLSYDLSGRNEYSGNATLTFTVTVDSNQVYSSKLDPCSGAGTASFCPATPGELAINANQETAEGGFDQIPNDTYTMQNPDAYFRFALIDSATNETVGCLQANFTNDASQTSASGNATDAGNGTGTISGNTNGAGDTNSSSSSPAGGSGASITYLNWTLFA